MKTFLLILGIILAVACVLSVLYAGLNLFAYRNTKDGSSSLYEKMHRRMIIFFASGGALALIAAACFIIRSRL